MARRAGGGLPGATQGVQSHTNGDVPPSTIAAKIVDNRSNALPGSKELFSKLLQEYLTDPAVEESSLETNAQLVSKRVSFPPVKKVCGRPPDVLARARTTFALRL